MYLVCITLLLAALALILVVSTQDFWLNKLFKSLFLHTVSKYRHTHTYRQLWTCTIGFHLKSYSHSNTTTSPVSCHMKVT